MTGAHLHLLLTHLPVIGTLIGLLVLSYGWLARRTASVQVGLWIIVFSGLAAVAVYFTGESAEEVIEDLPGISHAIIEQHEEAAFVALIAALLLSIVSLVGLWLSRKDLPRWVSGATLVLALVVSGIMAWTANLGGQINHPEIRPEANVSVAGDADGGGAESGEIDDDSD